MFEVSISDGIGVVGIILAILLVVLDKAGKLKGGWLYGLLIVAGIMTLFIAIGNSWVLDAPSKWKLWRGTLMICVVAFTYSGMALWIAPDRELAKAVAPESPKQDEKPPTLTDLFKKDFPNAMKASDRDADAYTIGSPDGSTMKIKRQTYMDFDAKTKFIGFYVARPIPTTADFSGKDTLAACLELLEHDAVRETFDHFDNQVAVLGGYGDQMTSQKELTFSGRVLIYHEEFLSIPQKAQILNAYKTKGMDVIFRGPDYLGTQLIAWHQQHDRKQ